MKALNLIELKDSLRSLEDRYDVRAPIRLADGTRALGRLDEGELAVAGGRLPRKPTDVFFPQHDLIFTAPAGGAIVNPAAPGKPLFVLGFTAEDLDCLEFIDRFFAAHYRDDLYFCRREGAVIAGVSGYCGEEGRMMRIAGGHCDLELVCDGKRFIVAPRSAKGREIEGGIVCAVTDATLEELQQASDLLSDESRRILQKASELIRADRVPDGFWAEIGDLCIACTGCNLVCPTCTCYGVQDRSWRDRTERSRMWDSCQLDGFMREASGHNPLGTEALRTRRRIHHKLAADPTRWGHLTCYLCGRCDAACPTGIGIQSVARRIVSRFA
jgi:formate hydrogenlyase subunit 6/NADH:ubiquinone oxidoreductase subunit I